MGEEFFSDDQLERIARAGLSGLLLAGAQQVQREVAMMERQRCMLRPHMTDDIYEYRVERPQPRPRGRRR